MGAKKGEKRKKEFSRKTMLLWFFSPNWKYKKEILDILKIDKPKELNNTLKTF